MNSDNESNVLFQINLQGGAEGRRGPEGPQGPIGPQGPVGPQGDCNFVTFEVEDGTLYYNKAEDNKLDFNVNNNGELEVMYND